MQIGYYVNESMQQLVLNEREKKAGFAVLKIPQNVLLKTLLVWTVDTTYRPTV